MTNWIRVQNSSGSPDELGPLQLAWLGDAVWDLHQRLRHCRKPGRSKDLHVSVVAEVNAPAQADALKSLEPFLSDSEKELVRRGRNRAGRGPKNGDPSIYAKATGFETIIGWLFLKNPTRLADLLDQLDKTNSDLQ